MTKTNRHLSAYESNHLLKYGFKIDQPEQYGTQPVEYVTGFAEFMDRDFRVNKHTLIPRVETELLVDKVEFYCKKNFNSKKTLTLADIGTGSGCIGISLWLSLHTHFPQLLIYLSDINPGALKIADQNKEAHIPQLFHPKIHLLESDLLLDFPDSASIDIIVANLPYIPTNRLPELDKTVLEHEPPLALAGGSNKGLNLIYELILQAEKLVSRPRVIFLEIDEYVEQKDLPKTKHYQATIHKDQFDKNRFAIYELKNLD